MSNKKAMAVINCKIRELKVELHRIQHDLGELFLDGMDDIDMPKEVRMQKLLWMLELEEDELRLSKGNDLLRRYATVSYAVKQLKEIKEKLSE